jgi:RHS repeat-associated protein
MTRAINPKWDTTLYVYDELGRVLYKSQPDVGTISYAYDRLGNVRFSQTEEQADSNRLTYTEYDDLNRVTMIGEATVDPPGGSGFGSRVSRGGGSGIVAGVARRGGKERSSLLSGASTLHRLTDTLDGNRLYLSSTYGGPVTVNTTIHLGTSGPAPPTLPALTLYDSVYCTLTMNEMLGETETPVGPFLGHPVQYYTPVTTPHGSMGNFEHLKFNPHFVRTVIAYDTMPAIAGSIWGTLPAWSQWDSLAPHGKVRNLRGHEAAIAYREHGGEPYHYVVMSYDERGRVEALMRYTENLGFDAVYYGYNSANEVTSVRVADPIREYQSWYGYDWNGRVDTVWSLLGGVWSGLGIRAPRRPAPLAQPSTPDIAYDYTKTGRLSAMRFPPAGVLVSYAYDHRKWLDSLVATQSASPLFKEVLGYDPTGQIVMQRYAHGAGSDQTELYRYDSAQRLVRWVHGADSTSWGYDAAGNRSDQIRRVPLAGLRTDSYTYGGTGVGGSNRLGDVITQDSTGAVTGLKQHAYNANGSLTSRTVLTGIGGSLLKEEHFGYGYRELTNQYIDGVLASSSRLDWRYRYNAQGEREQKRVYYGPDGDEYEHVYPWVYYLLGGAKEQLAVYHGQQMLGGPCTPSGRSVLLYPVEYNTFGVTFSGKLEDIALVSTRISSTSPGGAKEYKITDHLSSTRAVAIATGSTSEYDYTPSGSVLASSTGMAARLGFNGRQEDRESGDLNLGFRQFNDDDLRFLTIDRRREQFPEISPYVYSYDNPLRYTDPDGLQGRDMVFDPNPILPGGGRYGGGGAGGLGVLLFLFKGAEYMADQFHTWYNEATSQNDAPQAGKQTENQTAAPPTPQKSKDWKYYPVPETELIKGLNPAKGKTVIPGTRGKLRRRWKDADGKIYEWDSQHGTLEVYDKRGKHLKEINPSTGEETKGKNKDREVEP